MNLWAFTPRSVRGFAESIQGEIRTLRGWGSQSADLAALQATGPLAVHFEIEAPIVDGGAERWASGIVRTVHGAFDASDALLEWACGVVDRSIDGPPDACRAARSFVLMLQGRARGSVEPGTLAMVREANLEEIQRQTRAGVLLAGPAVCQLAAEGPEASGWRRAIDAAMTARFARRGPASEIAALRLDDARDLVRILERKLAEQATESSEGGAA